ncbi:rhythmically expressed gene 5 protein [Euwallacea fornicatus]|uniref:rhythmically expressed gene 5 protein n=1 Tax=Euwallacea fornicatus TaxID=995702 RepID=UPI00338F9190
MIGLAGVLCLCALFGEIQSSAIPMWEYLSKQEKTSYIYSLFANQVDKFCDGSNVPFCSRQLLKFGLGTLKNMDEDRLDAMDPYQREANSIIWETLMEGHRFQNTTPKPEKKAMKSKPNSYEDDSFSDYEDYGVQNSGVARLDNVYVLPPPKDFVINVADKEPQYVEEVTEGSGSVDILKTPDGKGVFNRFQNQFRPIDVTTEKVASSTKKPLLNGEAHYIHNPLEGPLVIRVYPDGTPVKESTKTPQDYDLRQYKLQHVKIPKL